jgi:hemerythrin
MDQFVWKSSFEIGIEKVDSEHKHLLKLLNDLNSDLTSTEGISDELKEYAESHFSDEEDLMQWSLYPGLQAHQEWHRFFENQVLQLEKAISKGGEKSISSLISFLRDWILSHILLEDKNFANYIHANFKEDEIANLSAHGRD